MAECVFAVIKLACQARVDCAAQAITAHVTLQLNVIQPVHIHHGAPTLCFARSDMLHAVMISLSSHRPVTAYLRDTQYDASDVYHASIYNGCRICSWSTASTKPDTSTQC